jgi:Fic family protein
MPKIDSKEPQNRQKLSYARGLMAKVEYENRLKKMIPFHSAAFPPRHLNRKRFSKQLEAAHRLLKKYNAMLAHFPSPYRLYSQLINLEAIASIESQTEKTTLENFLQFIQGRSPKKNSKFQWIFNYREALVWACQQIQRSPLNEELICTLHKKVKRETGPLIDLGTYRNRQNWIGPKGCTIEEAYFYPPDKTKVKELMAKLLHYAKKNAKDPLVQLALIFAQFLIIHPFMDGNGRVARILIPLFLYQKKAIPLPFLFMSRYFLHHRLQYFYNLFETTEENKWENWIAFFLKGMAIEMNRALRLSKQIQSLKENIEEDFPKLKKGTLFFLFQHPIFSISSFRKAKGNEHLLKELEKSKLIKNQMNRTYSFSPLLNILNESNKASRGRSPRL